MNPIAKVRDAVGQAFPSPRGDGHDQVPGPGSDAVLVLRGAAVRVAGRTLWSGVDLRIEAGEFTAVLGPNGVGKSTMIKVLLGALPAAAGEVRVLGLGPGQANDRIGYLPQ